MATHPTIIVSKRGIAYRICKVWFGTDGSFYVTVPYHPARKAVFTKTTVDYTAMTAAPRFLAPSDALEIAILDDDDARPKLSHHPDGFCQFSGPGVLSGKDETGKIKGIGVFSTPLLEVGPGPRFNVVIHGIEVFDRQENTRAGDIVFFHEDLNATSEMAGLVLEAYYFHPQFRRFIMTLDNGNKCIYRVHPSGIVLPLRVLLSPEGCDLPGFLGLELYAERTFFPEPSFALNGPGEKARTNEQGHKVADVIMSHFPAPIIDAPFQRDIGFKPSSG